MTEGRDFEAAILANLLKHTTKAYEEQLRELHSEKELAQITLASIGDGVVTTDSAGVVTYLNRVAETLTGWPKDLAVGRALHEVMVLVRTADDDPLALPLTEWLHGDSGLTRLTHLTLLARHGS